MGSDEGLKSAREYPLWDAIFARRSRRVAAGASFRSGAFSFQSKLEPQPLSKLEEAMLIASTGITGLAFADNLSRLEQDVRDSVADYLAKHAEQAADAVDAPVSLVFKREAIVPDDDARCD